MAVGSSLSMLSPLFCGTKPVSPRALQPRYLNEALLLMAKVHYVQGRYRDAQGMCARVGLEELTRDDQPVYHLRLLAEAFVMKGTCNL